LMIVKILKTEGYIKNFKKYSDRGKNLIRIFSSMTRKTIPSFMG